MVEHDVSDEAGDDDRRGNGHGNRPTPRQRPPPLEPATALRRQIEGRETLPPRRLEQVLLVLLQGLDLRRHRYLPISISARVGSISRASLLSPRLTRARAG